jgi:hypothetical protein
MALRRATADPAIGAAMVQLVRSLPPDSTIGVPALAAVTRHSADPSTALLTLLQTADPALIPSIVNELAGVVDAELDARLVEIGKEAASSDVRRGVATALSRRLTSDESAEVLNWLNVFAVSVDGEGSLVSTLEVFSRLRLPGRDQGVDYDPIIQAALGALEVDTIQAGLTAVSTLGEDTSDEICESIIALWEDVLKMEPAEQAAYREILGELPKVTRKIVGRPITSPGTLETWLQTR